MTGQQIVDNCHAIAERQYPEADLPGLHARALCEIMFLRTKVLELSKKLELTEPVKNAAVEALHV